MASLGLVNKQYTFELSVPNDAGTGRDTVATVWLYGYRTSIEEFYTEGTRDFSCQKTGRTYTFSSDGYNVTIKTNSWYDSFNAVFDQYLKYTSIRYNLKEKGIFMNAKMPPSINNELARRLKEAEGEQEQARKHPEEEQMEDFTDNIEAGIYCKPKDGVNLRFQITAVVNDNVTVKCVANRFGYVDGAAQEYTIQYFKENFYKDSNQGD